MVMMLFEKCYNVEAKSLCFEYDSDLIMISYFGGT